MVRTRNGRIISHAEYFANCRLPNGWLFKEFGTKTPPLGTGFLLTRCAARPLAPERQLTEELARPVPAAAREGPMARMGFRVGTLVSFRAVVLLSQKASGASSHLCPAGGGSFPGTCTSRPRPAPPRPLRPSPALGPGRLQEPYPGLGGARSQLGGPAFPTMARAP